MRRHGTPIRDYYLPKKINAGIEYSRSFAEAEACITAGLDYYNWRTDHYPQWFKSEVVAWHQMHQLIKSHISSAESKYLEKKGNK